MSRSACSVVISAALPFRSDGLIKNVAVIGQAAAFPDLAAEWRYIA
jgi:hypothetical protein